MSAKEIAAALGDATREGHDWRCRCPVHDGVSLTLRDGKEGQLVVKCFAGCEARDVLAAIRRRGLSSGEVREERPSPSAKHEPDKADKISLALATWRQSVDARGSLVERYLAGRALELPANHYDVLRFHHACPFKGQRVPAMVALFRDVVTDEPCGIHRTPLLPDGSDRNRVLKKAMLGRAGDAAIKLSPDDEVTLGLGLCEGIETGLKIMARGWRPIWACGSTSGMAPFPVLPGIEELTIFADNDANGAGIRAAQQCGERWLEAERLATIRLPRAAGADWADAA